MPHVFIDGVEKSSIAIENTLDNIKKFNCKNQLRVSQYDILKKVPKKKYDVVISNPPYIPIASVQNLDPSVQYYDPMNALTDFNDGMLFYRRIYKILKYILNDGGLVVLEFGDDVQCEKIIKIFSGFNYELIYSTNKKLRAIALS